ncbi:Zinc finger, PHD-finger [Kalmanozyma brasiliensis GHG001]|uniref:Zinc finger PHD-type domain-containing protein n=1 Tax=Kalmanozyma brasiliensis (strain GHG001) TaxID=1365824 RepID=V5ESA7_KALBG|nr:Zinc finger, PHD-finger [Kalmanozyma brasiliensis GHG001]EST05828.1 Zinc finger, PHD-finger [Kalmanozyma brasiliensis GHG001]
MPARRSIGAMAGPSAPAAPPVIELHPITKRLRKMWKFAAVCQFLFVFDEAFGMSGFETETLEADFENSETNVVPDLIKRLLYTLTLDRNISFDNWQHHLRVQFNLRDDEGVSRFGTAEQPVEWAQLSLEDKIATLHDLCEWQLMDPERFRKLVKSEEDITTWRVSPIGWDANDNAYWLFDDNRIWIQRPEPLPKPKAKARAPPKKGSKRARMEAAAARRAATSSTRSSSDNKRSRPSDAAQSSTPSKRTRSSLGGSAASTPSRPPPRRGTRTSSRFAPQDDETADTPSNGRTSRAAASTYSSDSELSEPPDTLEDDNDEKAEANAGDNDDVKMEDADAEAEADKEDVADDSVVQQDEKDDAANEEEEWIEFETIVVTRQEWLDFSKRFAKSKDANEKNLHQFINKEILEQVLAAMDEIERQRAMEQALANRKRSSRIALKESEREERERDREARARMEEKMALIRQEEEKKKQKEEEEHEAQRSREDRLREREERIRARELELETKAIREEEERERKEKEREDRIRKREEIIANGGVPPPSKETTPEPAANGAAAEDEEEWELNCEVCGKNAISPPDEDDEIVCCEQCSVWQHIKCWDSFDKQIVGLKKRRDWESVDFFCSKCRPPAAGTPIPHPGILAQRANSSPRSKKRSSLGPDSPSGKTDGAAATNGNAESPRQRIKLVSGSKNADAGKAAAAAAASPQPSAPTNDTSNALPQPPVIPSQTLRPPTAGAQPAETGSLTSSGPASRPVPAINGIGGLPPPSSHAVPSATGGALPTTTGRPLLSSPSVSSNTVGEPSKATNAGAMGAPSQSGLGLGMGRPTPKAQDSTVASPRSPSTGAGSATQGNGTPALSPRSPSYGANLGSPTFRRPSQASGSFPMRHTPAKSPLSRPYESNGEPPANGFSLPPPRASSPSAIRGGGGQYASLGATAKSLHPSSAAVATVGSPNPAGIGAVPTSSAAPPGAARASEMGNMFGHLFQPASQGASDADAAADPSTTNLPAGAQNASGAIRRGSVDAQKAAHVGAGTGHASEDHARKQSGAAGNALRTLELGVSTSPVGSDKAELVPDRRGSVTELKVVELPPTHVHSP